MNKTARLLYHQRTRVIGNYESNSSGLYMYTNTNQTHTFTILYYTILYYTILYCMCTIVYIQVAF